MKAIVTGAGGTVGAAVVARLRGRGEEVIAWDRREIQPHDAERADAWVRAVRPEAVFHLAIPSRPTGLADEPRAIHRDWTARLARLCRELGAALVYTSTAMVFSNDAVGPFTVDSAPDAAEGYGADKRAAEQIVLAEHPAAVVARLGWQIGDAPGSNNMVDFLDTGARRDGEVRASRRWLPACAFVADTASALVCLAHGGRGLYHLDANERWSFYDIASALARLHGDRWRIVPSDDFVYDQRLIDQRLSLPSLATRLPGLS
jgi:dTDP-4-dehydrorhamnose reductase